MDTIRLVSWNVNGFRALSGKPDWDWFASTDADVVALQETKAEPAQIAEEHRSPEGWNAEWLAAQVKKGYSGVAVFSRQKAALEPLAVHRELPDPRYQGEGRLLHIEYPAFHFFNVYFPNGTKDDGRLAYKMGYYDAFLAHAEELRRTKPIVVCGDFNIAHRAIERKTGARGLRNVMERTMLDIMFRLPSMPGVKECLINRAVIEKGKEPVLLYDESEGFRPTSEI